MSKVYSASPSSHAPSTSQQTGVYAEGSSTSLGTPGLQQHAPAPFPKTAYASADHFSSSSNQACEGHHGFSAFYRGHELRLARQALQVASPHCRPEACKQSSALLLLVIVIALCHLGKGWGKPRVVGLDSHKAQGQQQAQIQVGVQTHQRPCG